MVKPTRKPAGQPAKKAPMTEAQASTGRNAKADRAIKIWSSMGPAYAKLFKENKEGFSEGQLRNTAIALTSEAKVLRKMTEEQVATKFASLAPQQLLSIVMLTYPNLNRGNIFAEIALTSPNEAVFFVKPFFQEPFIDSVKKNEGYGTKMAGRSFEDDENPFGFGEDPDWDENTGRDAIMESFEYRQANQLANAVVENNVLHFYGEDGQLGAEFGPNSENFTNGYCQIFDADNKKNVVAMQLASQDRWFISNDYPMVGEVKVEKAADGKISISLVKAEGATGDLPNIVGFGRFNAETDYLGKYLGEVELRPRLVRFTPQRTSIGVSWTQFTEIIMDTGYDLDAQSILSEAASQTINSQLDYQAVAFAYNLAKTNKTKSGKPMVQKFNAAYSSGSQFTDSEGHDVTLTGAKDSYLDNAQTFSQALGALSAMMYNELQRGAITHLVCGLNVMNYITLLGGYSTKGKQHPAGIYQFGELDGIKLFAAPTKIIPANEALAIFKNAKVDNDVALAFGTLVPLTSIGPIPRKNFYTEAAMATYGDMQTFNKKYLSIIKIEGIKDVLTE